MDAKTTGKIISAKRREKALTQIQLAEILSVSNRTVSKWENGDGYPDITLLPDIAAALDITIDELLTGNKPKAETAENQAEITEIPNDCKNYKMARSKFLVSEITAFCLSIGANSIGGTTELMFYHLQPFYAFIEIYLLVAAVVLFVTAIIFFFTGFVKFRTETDNLTKGVLIQLYAFAFITSITPAFTVFRILSWVDGYFLRYLFLALYVLVLAAFTAFTVRKVRGVGNGEG